MAGLRMICKMYGGMRVSDGKETVEWIWDYAQDKPVRKDEYERDKKARAASERAKWMAHKKRMKEAQTKLEF